MTDRYQAIRDALPILIAEAQAKGGRNERAALIVELLEERDALREALEEVRSRSAMNLAMNSNPFELTAMLGDIHQIADAALKQEKGGSDAPEA